MALDGHSLHSWFLEILERSIPKDFCQILSKSIQCATQQSVNFVWKMLPPMIGETLDAVWLYWKVSELAFAHHLCSLGRVREVSAILPRPRCAEKYPPERGGEASRAHGCHTPQLCLSTGQKHLSLQSMCAGNVASCCTLLSLILQTRLRSGPESPGTEESDRI